MTKNSVHEIEWKARTITDLLQIIDCNWSGYDTGELVLPCALGAVTFRLRVYASPDGTPPPIIDPITEPESHNRLRSLIEQDAPVDIAVNGPLGATFCEQILERGGQIIGAESMGLSQRARPMAAGVVSVCGACERMALNYSRKLLLLDLLMEDDYRVLMRCHFHNGNRPLALRQYALCEQILREELDVEPMDVTRRVQETILAVSPRVASSERVLKTLERVPRSVGHRTPAQKVDMALSNINSARNWLEGASRDMRSNPRESS